jgi:MoaA/NifB/PqqE/SkfB family radical SAM enzyme
VTAEENAEGLVSIRRVFLWINDGCNARCRTCDIWRESPVTRLEVGTVAGWANEWAALGVSRVVVCGEPLLHPQLPQLCGVIRQAGLRVDLLTNGLLLSRRAAEVVSSCDALGVSLDGPQPVHDRVRGRVGAFDRLRAGLEAVRELAPELGVDGRCAVHRLNYEVLRETVTTALDLGLRSISFSATDLSNEEAFRRQGRVTGDYVRGLLIGQAEIDSLVSAVDDLVQDCARHFASGFISDPPDRLRRIVVDYYRGLNGLGPMPVPHCNAPWTSVVIEPDGTARPCFPMPAFGNVLRDTDLRSVIDGEAARALRQSLDVRSEPTCLNCVCQTHIDEAVSDRWANVRSESALRLLVRGTP